MARQRYGFDEAKIARFHKEGRGQGQGIDYKPWLTIGEVPSRGRSHRLQGIKTGRVHHLLSDIECGLFYLLDWSDAVTDIREQFPLDRAITQRIADQMGIGHPRDIATRTPLVMTTDFLITIVENGRMALHARAVKPAADLDDPRTLEKLEIESRYWIEQGVAWGIVTDEDLPDVATRNIGWVHNFASVDHLSQPYEGYFHEKAELLARELPASRSPTLRHFSDEMDLRLGMSPGTALLLVRHLLARKVVSCPMDRVIDEQTALQQFQARSHELAKASR